MITPMTLDQLKRAIIEAKRTGYQECLQDTASIILNRAGHSGDMRLYDLAEAVAGRVNPYAGRE